MNRKRVLAGLLLSLIFTANIYSAQNIVENGQGNAQIIIEKDAIRAVEIAAEQLQEYIEKVSGAKLPINNSEDENIPVKIYVGKSEYTEKLGIDGKEFNHGGFHIKSGKDWLALVGKDKLFSMPENMWPKRHGDLPKVREEFEKAAGENFRFPYAIIWKCYNRKLKLHAKDDHGSFNATTYFLRSMGIRWYLPDELGEIIPEQKTISLPEIDKKVKPDFPVRWPVQHAKRFGFGPEKESLWQWRLGWSQAPEVIGPGNCWHDIGGVTKGKGAAEANPEYFAIYEGVRHNSRQCLSSEKLLKANLRYIKALDKIFGDNFVNVVPADAYTAICQCELCKGKDTPEKGYRGLISNYVWGYVNKVATEIYKTHPDIKIFCEAYGTYRIPPDNIKKFSPNIVPCMAQHRHDFYDEEKKKTALAERKVFLDMLPEGGKIMINEKYRSGNHKPMFYPHIISEDLKSLKGISLGGIYEVFRKTRDKKTGEKGGIAWLPDMHLNLYITPRFWWDADQDIEKVLGYYYKSFYGPAEKEMKAFIEYSEKNWPSSNRDPEVIGELFRLIDKAVEKVDEGTIYAKRVAFIYDYIKPLKKLQGKMAMGRQNSALAYAVKYNRFFKDKFGEIIIDGKLDEKVWSSWPTYKLKDMKTGGKPEFQTTFKAVWDEGSGSMIFGVKCEEDNTENLNITAKKNGDMLVFEGDVVEILFETLSHSYYQIAISPNGVMTDLDRKDGKIESRWDSEATVATYIGDDFWSLEIKIPVAGENQAVDLPFNGVAGSAPVAQYPWYFNVGRVRVRGEDKQVSSFNGESFHDVMGFGKMHFRVIDKDAALKKKSSK